MRTLPGRNRKTPAGSETVPSSLAGVLPCTEGGLGTKIAYVRVSTAEQNEQRRISALAKHDIERWFTEKVYGKDTNRPQLQAMLEFAWEEDTT